MKETSIFRGLNLQYKYDLENNTLQANNCQVSWINLLKYVEIFCLALTSALREQILQPFAASSLAAPAHAATFVEQACPLLGRGVFTTFFSHSHNAQPKVMALSVVNGAEEISFTSSFTVSAHKQHHSSALYPFNVASPVVENSSYLATILN